MEPSATPDVVEHMLYATLFHIPQLRVIRAFNMPGDRYRVDPFAAIVWFDGHAEPADQIQDLHDALIDMWDERWKAMTCHPAVRARRRLHVVPAPRRDPEVEMMERWGWPSA